MTAPLAPSHSSPPPPGGRPPSVELRHAGKRFGSREALKDVDLVIRRGEVAALLGTNGAGKSTLVSLVVGLRRPSAGGVRLFGLDPRDRRARERCGVMLQDSGVHYALKVEELVRLFRSYYPAPQPVMRTLELAGLTGERHAPVAALSGGQRQRLYFALAVCGDPELLVLDEPSVGMDVQARRAFIDSIREFAASGKTILFATHHLDEADALAARIVVIDRGRLVADGPPASFKERIIAKRVTFTCDTRLGKGDFDGLPVQALELSDHRVRMVSSDPGLVLRELYRRGLELRGLEVIGANLEDVFVTLVRDGPER